MVADDADSDRADLAQSLASQQVCSELLLDLLPPHHDHQRTSRDDAVFMATTVRASLSEPRSLFASIVRTPGEDSCAANRAAACKTTVACSDVKRTLQAQLETLASVAQSAARQALELNERIGSLRFDASPTAREHGNARTYLQLSDHHTADLARRTEQFAALIFDTDRGRQHGEGVDQILKHKNRQLWDLFDEKETLRLELHTVNTNQVDQRYLETKRTNHSLSKENSRLQRTNESLEEDLKKTRIEADAWKSLAENVQEMQELAIAAFERCNALERENIELRDAMHAFAEGSTSYTVQHLRKIIAGLTEEVAQYKQREGNLKEKENMMRDKENNSIIRAMRKQTRDLKVCPCAQSQS